jgi:MFS transporter, DHA1 family, multidrug resistance protein
MTVSILGFSIYLIGIAFAPVYTPHLSERFGRRVVYFCSLPVCAMFLIGTGASQSFAALAVCQFFAGFTGGPCLVLIEDTFADIWSPTYTVTYYSFLTLASYLGAACGMTLLPLSRSALTFHRTNCWRLCRHRSRLAMDFLGSTHAYRCCLRIWWHDAETYPREILRRRAREAGVPHNLPKAQSGVTIGEMAHFKIVQLVVMLFVDPSHFSAFSTSLSSSAPSSNGLSRCLPC